jgi:hypothetical protein
MSQKTKVSKTDQNSKQQATNISQTAMASQCIPPGTEVIEVVEEGSLWLPMQRHTLQPLSSLLRYELPQTPIHSFPSDILPTLRILNHQ